MTGPGTLCVSAQVEETESSFLPPPPSTGTAIVHAGARQGGPPGLCAPRCAALCTCEAPGGAVPAGPQGALAEGLPCVGCGRPAWHCLALPPPALKCCPDCSCARWWCWQPAYPLRLGSEAYWQQVRAWPLRTERRRLLRLLRQRANALGLEALAWVRSTVPLCLTERVHSDPASRSYTPAHVVASNQHGKAGKC